MNRNIVLTTVEEDFKKIGLIVEDAASKDEGKGSKTEEPEGDKVANVKAADADAKKKKEDVDGASSDELDEVKSKRLKRHTSAERMKWRRMKRKGGAKAKARKYRKKSSVKRLLKRHRMRAQKLRRGKPAGRRRLVFGLDQVSNLLEEVQEIVSDLDEDKVENTVKTFANIAIIAEMLSRSFGKFAEQADDAEDKENLTDASKFFGEMAVEASEIAKAANGEMAEDEEFDLEAVEEVFKTQMRDLLNGLEMYADLTEDDELAADVQTEGDDSDECEDCGKEMEKCECPPSKGEGKKK